MASEDDPFTPAQYARLREFLGAEGDVAREGASNSARRDGPPGAEAAAGERIYVYTDAHAAAS